MDDKKTISLLFLLVFFTFFLLFGVVEILSTDDLIEGLKISIGYAMLLSLLCCGLAFLPMKRIKIPENQKEEALLLQYADYWIGVQKGDQKGTKRISGKIVLTKEQLVFYPSKISGMGTEKIINLSDVELAIATSRINLLLVACKDGTANYFTVFEKKKWANEINQLAQYEQDCTI